MNTKPAALEYVCQMCLALRPDAKGLRAFGYWKRLFERELTVTRERERQRMAYSHDWSALGQYVWEGFLIVPHRILLDIAGLLFRLRFPGAQALLTAPVYRSCGRVLSTITSISGQG